MPLLRPKPQSSPQHWSKDFVEHLRTVHFALVTVSVGLILLMSSKSYDPKIAASEMSAVLEISNLSSMASRVLGFNTPTVQNTRRVLSKNDDRIDIDYVPWFEARSPAGVFTFHVMEPNQFICRGVVNGIGQYAHLDTSLYPNTINRFAFFWDKLLVEKDEFLVLTKIARHGTVTFDIINARSNTEQPITIDSCGSPKCHPLRVASILFPPKREL